MKTTTKRKMYQKRRKKEKADQRKKELQAQQLGSTTAATYKYNSKNSGSKHNPRNLPTITNNHQQHLNNPTIGPITSYSQSLQLWWQTYCSAIEFHTRQHNTLRDVSNDQQLMLLEKYANEYETSSEEDYDDDNVEKTIESNINLNAANINDESTEKNVDEEYLKFLEITHKHRKDLLLKRAEGN
ncbi:hypothetical protein FF38_09135 [Lucilia cuprina]|uniref:Uncharacterized protein n=1 Tax=Lucilia cuprina TaxID=7375 RepID=A0A0L0CQR0_LUCCU|nr:hypothetical protein FF38_09135 [Lucilia cuprina]